ncbi:MAG TPA: FAD-binding oxidoreductase [Gaiellaceae bacterium]|nr:FAD-binding oxidoreductase [Gaiellaceae bacterium]
MASVDVAVVGAGITGLAVARELTARGHGVTVVDKAGIGAGASGVQPGGVRQQWGTRVACRLARESVAFWRDATERLESRLPLVLRTGGYLFVAQSDDTLERLAANVRLQNEEGVPSRIVTPEEAAELVPDLRAEAIAGGAWCSEDGYFDHPQRVVEAFAAGLDVRLAAVARVRPHSGHWRLELADGETLDAQTTVVAAGVDTPELLAPLGVDVPIAAEERYLFLSEPIADRLLEPLVVAPELRLAAKQLADGRVLASDLSARGDPERHQQRWRATIRAGIDELLPRLAYVSYSTLLRGVYDVTPDHQPILGPVPGHESLFVAAGFSGHGFMIAPAVARLIADAVVSRLDHEMLGVLGIERFAAGRLVPEPQLV